MSMKVGGTLERWKSDIKSYIPLDDELCSGRDED